LKSRRAPASDKSKPNTSPASVALWSDRQFNGLRSLWFPRARPRRVWL